MSKPGTVRDAPSAAASVPPVRRGCGAAENWALRAPSGAGAGAFALGFSPTIAMLTVAGDAGSDSAGGSGSAGPKGLGLAPRLRRIGGAAIAAFAAAETAGASGSAGAGLSTGWPAGGATNLRGGAFAGSMPGRLAAPFTFRSERISGGAASTGASAVGGGVSGGGTNSFGLGGGSACGARIASTFGDRRSVCNSSLGAGCQTNCRAGRAFAVRATISWVASFTLVRGGFAGLRAGVGETFGSFSRKSYHTSLLACGAIACAYSGCGSSRTGPEATHARMSPWVASETAKDASLGRANMLS